MLSVKGKSLRDDSQDVGLEAAIMERVRKSSLVEWRGTDNVSRLKHRTEVWDARSYNGHGRGAFLPQRSQAVRVGGATRSANAGMSSANLCENHRHRKPEGSWATSIVPG